MNEFFSALKSKRVRKEYFKSNLMGWITVAVDFFITALILYISGNKHYSNFFSVFTGTTISGIAFKPSISIYITSIIISFILSVAINYILSTFFVFEYGNVGRNKRGFIKFLAFAFFGLSITTTISIIGYVGLSGNIWIIKMIATFFVSVFNFFTRKYFVFNIALIRDDENTIKL